MDLKIRVKKQLWYLFFVTDKIFAHHLINKSCQLTFVLFLILSFLSIEIFKATNSKTKFQVSHNGFDVLVQGQFENSGQNLYVSKSGRIQFIRHWDLNYDGYHDLVFNTTHNRMDLVDTFIYLQKNQKFKSAIPPLYDSLPLYERWKYIENTKGSLLRIAGIRPSSLKVHDLDHDGYPEILLANTTNGFTWNSTSFLYWGSSEGYRKKTELPTAIAQDVCTADLNGNGYSEIIFANLGIGDHRLADPKNLFSSIYWGSKRGYSTKDRSLVETQASSCAVGDLDYDGHIDLILGNSRKGSTGFSIFWGSTSGPDLDNPTFQKTDSIRRINYHKVRPFGSILIINTAQEVSLFRLSQNRSMETILKIPLGSWNTAVADLDSDKRDELILATKDEVKIMWARQNYSPKYSTSLPAQSPRDLAVADLNNDDLPEIIVANSHSDKTYDVPSYIYWGNRWGYGTHRRQSLQTFEASAVEVGDVNLDGELDLLFTNRSSAFVKSPYSRENSLVYWGAPHRGYSASNVSRYPTNAAMGSAMADLDDDGFAELLFANMDDTSFIYSGSAQGPLVKKLQSINFPGSKPHNSFEIADLNKDGYLDVLLSTCVNINLGGKTIILWGSKSGLLTTKIDTIEYDLKGVANIRLADLNLDGWLDLFLAGTYDLRSAILWGHPKGFSNERMSFLEEPYIGNIEFADLDKDGFLDLVLCKAFDLAKYNNRASSKIRILFGGHKGFFDRKPIELPTFSAIDTTIADFNRDGHLDIAVAQYKGGFRDNYPAVIFWNYERGKFSFDHRTDLPGLASAGVLSTDLDADGWIDLLVVNHISQGNHNINSFLYWGSPSGFNSNKRTLLAAPGPHWTQNVDIGNLMSRKVEESYISVPIQIPSDIIRITIEHEASTPLNSRIDWSVRTSSEKHILDHSEWKQYTPQSSLTLSPQKRWLQYRATLVAGKGSMTPYLTAIKIRETE